MTKQFVFIDARVSDHQFLEHGVIPGAQPFLIDPSIDGLTQILDRLTNLAPSSLTSLSIVAHGAPGRLEIGPAGLSLADIAARSDELAAIGGFLAAGANVSLYACETGAGRAGANFVTALSQAIGADVAAAAHVVGAAELDGDWALDIGARQLASQAPFGAETRAAYRATLAAPVLGFIENFSTGTSGIQTPPGYGNVVRTADSSAPDGDGYVGVVTEGATAGDTGPYTQFGGYSTRFIDGQQADLRVYLNPNWVANESFQYTVAANGADGVHQRDFGFQVRANGNGAIEVGASNGATKDRITQPIPNAYQVTTAGWYTLQHNFNNVNGVLSVDMNLVGPDGVAHRIATLSNPADTIGTEVGGTRYGWFTDVSVAGGLKVDDFTLGAFRDNVIEANSAINQVGGISFTDTDPSVLGSYGVTVAAAPAAGQAAYIGTLTAGVTSVPDVGNPGAVNYTFQATAADIDRLAEGQIVNQNYNLTLTEGGVPSPTRTVTVTLQGTNDAATAANNTFTQTYTEDTPLNLNDIVVNDVDDGAVVTARLTLNNTAAGVLTTAGGGSYNANTGIWVVSGTVAAVNTALAAVSFSPAANYNQAVTITTSVSDQFGAGPTAGTITLNGTAVNDAPVNSVPASIAIASNGTGAITGLSVSDVDAGNASVTTTLAVQSGTISVAPVAGGATVAGSGTNTVTLTGTIAQINITLSANDVTYTGTAGASTQLTVTTNDGGATGGGARTDVDTATLAVASVNPPGGGGGGGGGSTPATGTSGADSISGTSGNDNISSGAGADTVYAGQGSDTITAGDGGNILVGGEDSNDGADAISSGSGNDLIYGNGGDDTISSTGGNDVVVGGFGNDLISAGSGNDLIYGNESNDTISAGEGQNVVTGGRGDDQISAGAGADLLYGNEGSDTIVGGDGDNTIVGGQDSTDSADRLSAGSGNDFILGNGGDDTVGGGEGNNSLVGGYGNDAITAGAGNDVLYGNQDNDTISAGDGANLIFGGMGDDAVTAGSGSDTIWGNEGNDTLLGGTGADRYVFAAASGADLINGFSATEGDKLDLQGQTYTVAQDANGNAVLTLSGGGFVTLAGVASNQVNAGFFA